MLDQGEARLLTRTASRAITRTKRTRARAVLHYELSLVEQELRGFGVDLDDHSRTPTNARARKKRR